MADQEIKSGSTATLSCIITGISESLTVTWQRSTGDIITSGSGFTVDSGKTHCSAIIGTY